MFALLAIAADEAGSAHGFIAEASGSIPAQAYLRTHVILDPGPARETWALELDPDGELPHTLFVGDAPIVSGEGEPLRAPALAALGWNVRHLLGVPLEHAGTRVGLLVVCNREGGYDASHLERVRPVAAACARLVWSERAIRSRTAAQHLKIDRLEVEQDQLVADLHDDLGQLLTCAQLQLSMVDQGSASLDEVVGTLTTASQAVRTLIRRARTRDPRRMGLDGLQRSLDRLCTAAQVELGFHVPSEPLPLQPDVLLEVMQILKESVTNAVRHARCSRIDVEVRLDGASLLARVTEGGLADARPRSGRIPVGGGHGTSLMLDRAGRIGGRLQVTPHADGGTVVSLVLPLPAQHRDVPADASR